MPSSGRGSFLLASFHLNAKYAINNIVYSKDIEKITKIQKVVTVMTYKKVTQGHTVLILNVSCKMSLPLWIGQDWLIDWAGFNVSTNTA